MIMISIMIMIMIMITIMMIGIMVLSAVITSDPHKRPPPLRWDRGRLHPPVLHSALGVLLPALGSLELTKDH